MIRVLLGWAVILCISCTRTPLAIEADAVPTGVEVRTSPAPDRVEVRTLEGRLLSARDVSRALTRVWVGLSWRGHQDLEVYAYRGEEVAQALVRAPDPTDNIQVSAPLGQDEQRLEHGGSLHFPAIEGTDSQVGISVLARTDEPVVIQVGAMEARADKPVPGERVQLHAAITVATPVRVTVGTRTVESTLVPEAITQEQARSRLEIRSVRFPTDFQGHVDLARPGQQVTIPGRWWSAILDATSLGFRPHDRTVPWAHQAVTLHNHGDTPMNVGVQVRVTRGGGGEDGQPDPAFFPRMRDVDDGTGWTNALLRIPANADATAVLPLFVDEAALSEDNRNRQDRTHHVWVSPMGSTTPFSQHSQTLPINRGSTLASLGIAIGLLASLCGTVLLGFGVPRWLRTIPTTGLVTISLFATLAFVVGAAAQLLGMGVASVLGPFAFILTGLVDDTLRACLLATLLVLRPRVGVCALAVVLGWMLRAVATGSASPTDLLYLTGHVFFLEAALWAFGLTRPGAQWPNASPGPQWLRLTLAFTVAFSASIGTALAFNVVLYRLFYAPWYVVLNLLLSGIVYPAIAMGLAVPFARSLRAVED